MAKKFPFKDPDEVLDYEIDWSPRMSTGDAINGSAWTVPAGLTMMTDSYTDTATVVWLSGGTIGVKYSLLNRITTGGGRTMDQTVSIQIKSK